MGIPEDLAAKATEAASGKVDDIKAAAAGAAEEHGGGLLDKAKDMLGDIVPEGLMDKAEGLLDKAKDMLPGGLGDKVDELADKAKGLLGDTK
jgi:hypothetical protein